MDYRLSTSTSLSQSLSLVHPLLGLTKADLQQYMQHRGLRWLEDGSNADADHCSRNRVRLQLLPLMASIAGGEQALQR